MKRYPDVPHEKVPRLALDNDTSPMPTVQEINSSKNVDTEFFNALPVARKSLPHDLNKWNV